MRIMFQTEQLRVTWNLPFLKRDDENAIMDWAKENKVNAEGINGVAQIIRLVGEVISN